MGLLTPVAIKLGSFSWMPRLLPQITWIDKHLQRLTRGRVGFVDLAGLPGLLLTVAGRKSGIPRSTPLLCVPWQGGWLVAGSSFGAPKPPVWVGNVRAAETVEVRYRRRTVTCTWREITGDEKERAWAHMVTVWPNYDKYVEWTDRVIPVFLLTPR
ncbi:nitroreductase family deazaflavin-dependent oxidoreductase [Nocardioides caeni]|uniref:Nitroreductase family deazaflavin-dependent oxidoreductase n=1 Tax=Nocardioides caeni TaxID=574700 RepID=A0A4S8NAB3_9ACTN|nr:nitroreductase family deazaflavin-dependent oxidoreductase [Nocardioides caeni]THV13015.1 nitroreductase family deazaflavin-dependent oxidoreductase [Nocardioides caeni]